MGALVTRIAITMGDPAGIGPEIIVKALAARAACWGERGIKIVVLGSYQAHRLAAERLGIADPAGLIAPECPSVSWPTVAFLPVRHDTVQIKSGVLSAEAGQFAYDAVRRAVDLAQAGTIDAICTAPLNKEALNLAGHHYSGHTELLADLTGVRSSVMMLVHDTMRVSHVSTHVALTEAPSRLTTQRLRQTIELTVEVLGKLGIAYPRIAVAALNPHAGEGGLFGREDLEITAPLLAVMCAEGFDVTGPVPADSVFVKLRAGQYDAVVAQYHDQGHIPVKLLGFTVDAATGRWTELSGVNITLGLPIIRTSVDHGTAFDIAGKGIANETSLLEAIDFAARLATGKPKEARA